MTVLLEYIDLLSCFSSLDFKPYKSKAWFTQISQLRVAFSLYGPSFSADDCAHICQPVKCFFLIDKFKRGVG